MCLGWWRCWGCPGIPRLLCPLPVLLLSGFLPLPSRLVLASARGLAAGLRVFCTRTFACVRLLLALFFGLPLLLCCVLGCGTGLLLAACGLVVCVCWCGWFVRCLLLVCGVTVFLWLCCRVEVVVKGGGLLLRLRLEQELLVTQACQSPDLLSFWKCVPCGVNVLHAWRFCLCLCLLRDSWGDCGLGAGPRWVEAPARVEVG